MKNIYEPRLPTAYRIAENIVKVNLLFGLEYFAYNMLKIVKVIKQTRFSNILGISFEATREVRSRTGNVSRWC